MEDLCKADWINQLLVSGKHKILCCCAVSETVTRLMNRKDNSRHCTVTLGSFQVFDGSHCNKGRGMLGVDSRRKCIVPCVWTRKEA